MIDDSEARAEQGGGSSAGENAWDDELDATGLFCPEPVMLLHNRIADIAEGQVLKVIATDPSTMRDIPRFCQFLNHQLLANRAEGKQFIFLIRRGC